MESKIMKSTLIIGCGIAGLTACRLLEKGSDRWVMCT